MTASTKTPLGADTTVNKYYHDVNTSTYESPIWVPVGAIYSFKPVQSPTVKDDSDFDSDWGSDGVVLQKWGIEEKFWRKRKVATPTEYDDGQEFLRELGSHVLGQNIADIRYYEMADDGPREEAYRGYAAVAWVPDGGATEDYDSITVTLHGRGNRNPITHPDTVASVPTVAAVTPATDVEAGGAVVVISGCDFMVEGVDDVVEILFGAVACTVYTTYSDNLIAATVPAGTGAVNVTVENATGVSTSVVSFLYT
jgi:hypothetical protein